MEKQDKRFEHLAADVEESRTVLDAVDKELELFYETNRNKRRHQFEGDGVLTNFVMNLIVIVLYAQIGIQLFMEPYSDGLLRS